MLLDMSNPTAPVELTRILMGAGNGEPGYGPPNSVATWNGYMAVALDAEVSTDPGFIRIYDMMTYEMVDEAKVKAMPDMVYWRKDGKRIYAACEGEPASQDDADSGSDPTLTANPAGHFSFLRVKVGSGVPSFGKVKNLDMQAYIDKISDEKYAELQSQGFRIDPRVGGKANAGKDMEPEYMTVSPNENIAFLTLQENNAIARINLRSEQVESIMPLGARDLSLSQADVSDKDGINIRNWDNVHLWYQPDTIASYKINDVLYLFTANEGDSKEEKRRVKDLEVSQFDTSVFSVDDLTNDKKLARLNMDPLSGLANGYDTSKGFLEQGPYNKIYAYGARSFSIIRAKDGQFEKIIAADINASACFNCDRDEVALDSRSDNAGPEPEAMEVFELGGCTYATVGLERQGGFLVYDVSNPEAPEFLQFIVDRDLTLKGDDGWHLLHCIRWQQVNELAAYGRLHRLNAEDCTDSTDCVRQIVPITPIASGQILEL
eukprot:gene28959-32152_t